MDIEVIDWARADEAYRRGQQAYIEWCCEIAKINAAGDRQDDISARYGVSRPAVAQACVIGNSGIVSNANNLPKDRTAIYHLATVHQKQPEMVEKWLQDNPEPDRKAVAALKREISPPKPQPKEKPKSDAYNALVSAWKAASDEDRTKFLNYIGRAKHGEAAEIIAFLNEKTGRNYRPTPANLQFVAARLKEGYTASECRAVIVRKARQWQDDEKMAEYLRPATLFNREKFNQYAGELTDG